MAKSTSQEDAYSAKTLKKGNLEFANLWNKTNVRIASELQKTTNASKIDAAKAKPTSSKKHR